ncbi:MFS transporter [Promethearchaeum syntrophicum]|uniref:MFS transporter n=1 Tax=Promethearchaeum syntrophicum TaxID=2594042 RepID=A0A5B9DAQ5_9ARCH|nr:MFS transporter [Candidatus Prometheoarchaeum syntrophicum]QEE16223.1 Major Facilitator Superfamily protein [Candidatus Prometheoarchaeum syntrophicum]
MEPIKKQENLDIHLDSSNEIIVERKVTDDFNEMVKIVFWNSLGFLFYIFIIPYVTAQIFAIDETLVGLIIAAQPIGRLFTTPFVGYLIDKSSKKRLVLIGSLGRTISYSIMWVSIGLNSPIGFASGVFIQGVLVGFFWPPFNTLVAEKSSKFYRSEAYGKRGGMIGYGAIVGGLISFSIFNLSAEFLPGNVWIQYSPLILFALLNAYAGFRFYTKVDESLKFYTNPLITDSETQNTMTKNSKSKKMIVGFLFLFLATMVSAMNKEIGDPFIQIFMLEEVFYNTTWVMLALFIARTISLILAPKLGIMGDRLPPLLGISILSIIGALLTWFLINTDNLIIFSLLLILDFAVAQAGSLIIQNLISRISTRNRGKIFAIIEWMKLLGWIIGPIIGGATWQYISPRAPFITSIFMELSLILIYYLAIMNLARFLAEKVRKPQKVIVLDE